MHSSKETRTRLRPLGALAATLGLGWFVIAVYAVHASVPHNALHLPYETVGVEQALIDLAPESWKFFTKDPQDERLLAYSLQADGTWKPATQWPNASLANLYGMNRKGRAQGLELGLLLSVVPGTSWVNCKEQPEICLQRLDTSARIKNIEPEPAICGVVGVVLQKPLPFAWRDSTDDVMPSRVARVEVQC